MPYWGELTEAECEIMGTRVHLRVLRDSGIRRYDPLTGAPVLVAEGTRFASSWPEAARPYLAQPFWNARRRRWKRLRCVENAPKLRLLPFRSVGTASGLLLGYTAEHVRIGCWKAERVTVALSPTPVSEGQEYDALWGGPVE